jgi:preprotein translocase subunit SecE
MMGKTGSDNLKKNKKIKVVSKDSRKASGSAPSARGPDYVKWALVALILAVAMVANIHYEHISPSLRLIAGIVAGVVMLLIAWRTSHGQKAWGFFKEARNEIRRVSWPTRQQTTQVTMVVAAMVAVAAVAIFLLDQLFMVLIRLVMG